MDRGIKAGFGAAIGAAGMRSAAKAAAPSDKVVVGVMGVGGRGTQLTGFFASRPDVEIAYVCDVNSNKLPGAVKVVEDKKGKTPKAVGDFRRILEDKSVDAIVCATPDHWHSLAAVLACQAGKDIYVEKPASHDIWEGRKMVEAARKYNRVVQVGHAESQQIVLRDGARIDPIRQAGQRSPGARLQHAEPHAGGGYARQRPAGRAGLGHVAGPGPQRAYNPKYFRRVFWEFNGGIITDDGVHQLDLARAVTVWGFPSPLTMQAGSSISKTSPRLRTRPLSPLNTTGLTLIFEETWWTPYMIKVPTSVRESTTEFPDWYPFHWHPNRDPWQRRNDDPGPPRRWMAGFRPRWKEDQLR